MTRFVVGARGTVRPSGARASIFRGSPGDSEAGAWELASRAPRAELSGCVASLEGYVERRDAPLHRRELPGTRVVVILELGPPLAVGAAGQPLVPSSREGSFVVGVRSAAVLTAHRGYQEGVQLNLTALGAHVLFGVPMFELSERVVPLGCVFARERALVERLRELRTWDARFDLLEEALAERLARSTVRLGPIARALDGIAREKGGASVAAVARALGCSQKHLITLFRRQVGICPKLWCRLTRFEHLVRRLEARPQETWAGLAVELGFYDQAHLAREVRQFAGLTPTELRGLVRGRPSLNGAGAAP